MTYLLNVQATEAQVKPQRKEKGMEKMNLMLSFDKINGIKTGALPTTTKVGSVVVNGEWKAVFLQTRTDGSVVVNKRGEVQFNIK